MISYEILCEVTWEEHELLWPKVLIAILSQKYVIKLK